MTAVLHIRLFGGLTISQGDTPLSSFISNKVPALLAYLAVTHRPHQRDTLAALFWGEMSEADAKNNLRQALSNLRKQLEPYLLITRETVQFNTAVPHTLDTTQFEAHLQASRDVTAVACAAALQQATDLYQGDFLTGVLLRDAPDFEEWLLAQRVRFRELALHALHSLTQYHLDRAEYGRAIDNATRLLALDAWREEAHRQLMLALAHSGQRSAALAQYATCCRLLADELGVEPSTATRALFERIQAAGQMPPHNLPLQPTAFIGREAELAHIESLLLKAECRLLTLVGTGGMGKTRLAVQAADRAWQRGLFLQGVCFVALEGVATVILLATAVAQACHLTLAGGQEPQTQLLNFLRNKEMLLVLDNFEQLLTEATWLVKLLSQAPGIKLLVTSRERLAVQWEWSLPVEGLPFPTQPETVMADYSAVQLFMARAQAVQPDLAVTMATQQEIGRICQLVDGIPLGIELAAASLRHFTCAEIRQATAQNLDFLTSRYRDTPPRQRSLRAVFDYSWGLLTPAERALFAALSVFRGGFTLAAAAQIAQLSHPVLATLVDKSLLRWDEGNGRYHLHEMLRQYADQQLDEIRRSQLQSRHAHYFAAWLQQQDGLLFTPQQATILAALNRDHDNLRAYWQWATSQAEFALLAQGIVTFRNFYDCQSRFVEGRDWLEQTAAGLPTAVSDEARRLQAKLLARWASFCARSGQSDQAEALFQQALPLAHQLAGLEEVGFILLNWGYLTVMTSANYKLAEQQFAESLAYCQQAETDRGVADALSALGALGNITGEWDRAKLYLQESVAIARVIQNESGLCSSLTNLGNIFYLAGDLAQASRYYCEVVGLCQKLGDREAEAIVWSNLGAIAYETANYAQAEHLLQQGMTIFQAINSPQSVIQAATMLCGVYRAMAQFEQARMGLQQALVQALEQHLDHLLPHVLFELGLLYEALGQAELALELLYWVTQSSASIAEHRRDAQKGIERLGQTVAAERVTAVQQRSLTLDINNVLAQLADERPLKARTCRTCGRDYTDLECPHCRANRMRLRGR